MKINFENAMVTEEQKKAFEYELSEAHRKIYDGTGEGADFLGWLNLKVDEEELLRIKNAAEKIKATSDVLVVIGIGGSYLGARAVIDALSNNFGEKKVLFAGNNLSPDYLNDLLDYIDDKRVCLNVISKSGTTIEPAISFKILREYMEKKYGEEAKERIFVTTDKEKGVLKEIANQKGYETFVVPDDIGGRYSVFTAVGLLPIAAAGIDVDRLLAGVYAAEEKYSALENNPCYEYAVVRNVLYKEGKKVELLANYEPKLHYIIEWWKQLFGESEGKDLKGIFPAGVDYTTDLHSMGQYIQEGERHLFETVIDVQNPYRDIMLEADENAIDKLGYLNGKTMNEANHSAMQGTIIAHVNGKVPNILIQLEKLDEENIGELLYFFEKACGISGYILGVNPFNQPGVEAYKKEMFRLLGK
ncbi:MAG: glucose-6-phosphate isomerase [Clostridia bacterium]|nr:glucose-6-phosphate isomerase [Clostridia bacterium]